MNKVYLRWCLGLLRRAFMIQLLALGLVGLLEGAERAVLGAWSGLLSEVFLLHLHGLGFYFVLAVLWTDREWLLGGDRRALEVAGYSGRELLVLTVTLGFLWASMWGSAGFAVQQVASEAQPHWSAASGPKGATWLAGAAPGLPDLSIRVEDGTVVFVRMREPGQQERRWAEGADGAWAGEQIVPSDGTMEPIQRDRGTGLLLALAIVVGQGVVIGAAGGLSLWAGFRYAWLAVLGIALVALLGVGINSAVVRGFWSPSALFLLPILALVALRLSWSRPLGVV